MNEEIMNFELPVDRTSMIKVVGVGGGGGNALNYMYKMGIKDVDFVVCNTDVQALNKSPVSTKIQIGESLTEGRGAGNNPEIGKQAAIENLDDVMKVVGQHTKMIFVTAGMGGGTGTGAAPVIAKAAKEAGILTVAIVTIPFRFEGPKRINQAKDGIRELREYVDSMLVINNEKLREIFGDLKLSQAFSRADNVLATAAKGIAEIITVTGYVNVDFADVQTVMENSGVAILGSATGEGEDRAISAIKEALASPLLNDNDISGADNILLNITSGEDEASMDEVSEITEYITGIVNKSSNIIWGTGVDDSLDKKISVTVIATGFEANHIPELYVQKEHEKIALNDKKKQRKKPVKQHPKTNEQSKKEEQAFDFEVSQRSIEFDNQNKEESLLLDQHDHEDVDNSSGKIKQKNHDKKQEEEEQSYNILNKKNIDELETIPAYIRKKIKLEDGKYSSTSNVSKYSLEDDEKDSNKTNLRSDNPFLHDNVD